MNLRATRAWQVVKSQLIDPYFEKQPQYVGVELEFPILGINERNSMQLGCDFLRTLIDSGEFTEETRTASPELMRVNSTCGDSISFDYSYAVMEFSMCKADNLLPIATRFYRYFEMAQGFYTSHGCRLEGLGTNPDPPQSIHFVNSSYSKALRRFICEFTPQHDPKYYLCNMQSIQTHVEVPAERLVDCFNLNNRLDFARGLLFANSPPHADNLPQYDSYEQGTIIARDHNWEQSGFPNTGICDRHIANADALTDYYTEKQMCFGLKGLDFYCFEPTPLVEFFANDRPEEEFGGFFNVERVTLNGYHVLEFRGDCTQPLDRLFAPSAFNVGICYNIDAAQQTVTEFLQQNGIDKSNSQLRRLVATGKAVAPRDAAQAFLQDIVACARQGLLKRGYGEERLLEPLQF